MCIFRVVAFVIDGAVLPPDVVIANTSGLVSGSVRCLGAEGNTGLSVQLYEAVNSGSVTKDLAVVGVRSVWIITVAVLNFRAFVKQKPLSI